MAGNSEKKKSKEIQSLLFHTKIEILIISLLTLLCYIYNVLFNSYELCKTDYISLSLLTAINYVCYSALGVFYQSMWEGILRIILILNLVILVGINYSYKFWWLHASIPLYYSTKIFSFILNYVKGIGKSTPEDELTPQPQQPTRGQRQKVEVIKR